MIAKQLSFLIVAAVFFFAAQFLENHFFPVVEKFTGSDALTAATTAATISARSSGVIFKTRRCL